MASIAEELRAKGEHELAARVEAIAKHIKQMSDGLESVFQREDPEYRCELALWAAELSRGGTK